MKILSLGALTIAWSFLFVSTGTWVLILILKWSQDIPSFDKAPSGVPRVIISKGLERLIQLRHARVARREPQWRDAGGQGLPIATQTQGLQRRPRYAGRGWQMTFNGGRVFEMSRLGTEGAGWEGSTGRGYSRDETVEIGEQNGWLILDYLGRAVTF